MKSISVIIPVFNSEKILMELFQRITYVILSTKNTYEISAVNFAKLPYLKVSFMGNDGNSFFEKVEAKNYFSRNSNNSGSISIALFFDTNFDNGIVKAPFPGPISRILSSILGLIISIILLIVFLSIRKFCPHDFFMGILF